MKIEKKPRYFRNLTAILSFIAKDKISAARNFEHDLNAKLKNLPNAPHAYRMSNYFSDERYRDLTYKGYTVIYKITDEAIQVLDIFKWVEK